MMFIADRAIGNDSNTISSDQLGEPRLTLFLNYPNTGDSMMRAAEMSSEH